MRLIGVLPVPWVQYWGKEDLRGYEIFLPLSLMPATHNRAVDCHLRKTYVEQPTGYVATSPSTDEGQNRILGCLLSGNVYHHAGDHGYTNISVLTFQSRRITPHVVRTCPRPTPLVVAHVTPSGLGLGEKDVWRILDQVHPRLLAPSYPIVQDEG